MAFWAIPAVPLMLTVIAVPLVWSRRRSGLSHLGTVGLVASVVLLPLPRFNAILLAAPKSRVDDIIKVTFWMGRLDRKPINDEWVKMFPDDATRPARQIMEVAMEPEVLVQCDFIAVIGG